MANGDVVPMVPVGERLGTERLYDEYTPPPDPAYASELPKPKPKGRPRGKARKQPPKPTPEVAAAGQQKDVDWRGIGSSWLEVAGIVAITVGCAMIAPWLAFVVGGVLLVILGVATGLNVTK